MQGQICGARGYACGLGTGHPYVSIATEYADIVSA
jgi:hypothetical protein